MKEGKLVYYIKDNYLVEIRNIKSKDSFNKFEMQNYTKPIVVYMLSKEKAESINNLRIQYDEFISTMNETFKTLTYSIAEGNKKDALDCMKILNVLKPDSSKLKL